MTLSNQIQHCKRFRKNAARRGDYALRVPRLICVGIDLESVTVTSVTVIPTPSMTHPIWSVGIGANLLALKNVKFAILAALPETAVAN